MKTEHYFLCTCPEDQKHGETSVMCCNECGLPTEKFLLKPPYPEIARLRDIETRIRARIKFLQDDLEYLRKRFGDNPRNRLTIAVNEILVAEFGEMLGK